MEIAPLPPNESDRLETLYSCDLLDSVAERGFDDIVDLAAAMFQTPIALVSLIDSDRQWIKAKFGLEVCETGRDEAFCSHAILDNDILVVPDAKLDPRFHDNPFVTQPPHIRFYAGAPLIDPSGHALGTLCIIDSQPRHMTGPQLESLAMLAQLVVDQIEFRNLVRQAATYQSELEDHKLNLEMKVARRTKQLVESREDVVQCLARAAEFRDDDTGHHVRRVSLYVREICEELGFKPGACDNIGLASTLHDVGKIGVPDSILLKPGKLTADEFAVMQNHANHGCDIITQLDEDEDSTLKNHCGIGQKIIGDSKYDLLQTAARIALSHHERFDGTGYPKQLAGEDIPIEGRIVAVADVFDALTSTRPYKPSFSIEKSCEILREGCGSHFDPKVLEAFFARLETIVKIRETWQENEIKLSDHAA